MKFASLVYKAKGHVSVFNWYWLRTLQMTARPYFKHIYHNHKGQMRVKSKAQHNLSEINFS